MSVAIGVATASELAHPPVTSVVQAWGWPWLGSRFHAHYQPAVHNQVARCVHQVIVAFDDLARPLVISVVISKFAEPVRATRHHLQLA